MNLNVILSIFRKERDFKDLIVIGGGAKGDIWLQILADIFNLDIVKPNYLEEATSMGAAITGGVGVGEFKDFSAIHKFLKPESKVSPIPEHVEEYKKMIPIFDHAYDALVEMCIRDRAFPGDFEKISSLAIIAYNEIRMANLCVAVCKKVNGVSQIHGDILKTSLFRDNYVMDPEKFIAITNGITHRRWLAKANPPLTKLIRCV